MVRIPWRLAFWLTLLVFLFGPATVRCEPAAPVRVALPLTTGFAPLVVTIRVIIPRSDLNREACLILYLDGESTSSCWTLNGSRDGVEFQRRLKLGPGDYVVTATLRRVSGTLYARPLKLRALAID